MGSVITAAVNACIGVEYFVLALCLYCFYSLFSFLVIFYSYYIDVQLSHLNKDYLLTYLIRCGKTEQRVNALNVDVCNGPNNKLVTIATSLG